MVDFGARNQEDEPTSTHIKRIARKYNLHKLEVGVNHINYERHHGGESAKPKRAHKK